MRKKRKASNPRTDKVFCAGRKIVRAAKRRTSVSLLRLKQKKDFEYLGFAPALFKVFFYYLRYIFAAPRLFNPRFALYKSREKTFRSFRGLFCIPRGEFSPRNNLPNPKDNRRKRRNTLQALLSAWLSAR